VIGLPKQYRKVVERLLRMKRLSVVIATESLSMGINMPTKTSIFAGDNVSLNPMVFRQVNPT
jgi:ATP-dependent RNA helicase DDX60